MSGFNKDTGELITANTAATMVQEYMTEHNIDPSDPNETAIYGFAFGINKVKAMIAEIDAYNAGPKAHGEIIGVRVYKGMNTYQEKPFEDVFLIPITALSIDLYPVRTETNIDQITPNIILDSSIPCPSACNF